MQHESQGCVGGAARGRREPTEPQPSPLRRGCTLLFPPWPGLPTQGGMTSPGFSQSSSHEPAVLQTALHDEGQKVRAHLAPVLHMKEGWPGSGLLGRHWGIWASRLLARPRDDGREAESRSVQSCLFPVVLTSAVICMQGSHGLILPDSSPLCTLEPPLPHRTWSGGTVAEGPPPISPPSSVALLQAKGQAHGSTGLANCSLLGLEF